MGFNLGRAFRKIVRKGNRFSKTGIGKLVIGKARGILRGGAQRMGFGDEYDEVADALKNQGRQDKRTFRANRKSRRARGSKRAKHYR